MLMEAYWGRTVFGSFSWIEGRRALFFRARSRLKTSRNKKAFKKGTKVKTKTRKLGERDRASAYFLQWIKRREKREEVCKETLSTAPVSKFANCFVC